MKIKLILILILTSFLLSYQPRQAVSLPLIVISKTSENDSASCTLILRSKNSTLPDRVVVETSLDNCSYEVGQEIK